jgi:hypothetical protein
VAQGAKVRISNLATPTKESLTSVRLFLCLMKFSVYILFSSSLQKFYTGQTHDLQNRLEEHNSGETK